MADAVVNRRLTDSTHPDSPAIHERLGIEILEATPQRVVGTMPVEGNTQPFGLLHGGASCVLAESLGSIGATLHGAAGAGRRGHRHQRHPSPGRLDGVVTGVATPLHLGRTVASYEVVIRDDRRTVASAPRGSPACWSPRSADPHQPAGRHDVRDHRLAVPAFRSLPLSARHRGGPDHGHLRHPEPGQEAVRVASGRRDRGDDVLGCRPPRPSRRPSPSAACRDHAGGTSTARAGSRHVRRPRCGWARPERGAGGRPHRVIRPRPRPRAAGWGPRRSGPPSAVPRRRRRWAAAVAAGPT